MSEFVLETDIPGQLVLQYKPLDLLEGLVVMRINYISILKVDQTINKLYKRVKWFTLTLCIYKFCLCIIFCWHSRCRRALEN